MLLLPTIILINYNFIDINVYIFKMAVVLDLILLKYIFKYLIEKTFMVN